MRYRLPHLPLLRTFEAAARHLSFKKAAAELCVTPAAVSQQIKALEVELGVPLFHRMTRALALTEQGRNMLPKIREGFDCLAAAIEGARQAPADRQLTVTAPPSFAGHWLLPRLPDFTHRHPEVALRLSSTPDTVDRRGEAAMLKRLDADLRAGRSEVAILYGRGDYAGYVVDRLFSPDYVPVCAPALITDGTPLRRPADLARHVLIHDETLDEGSRGQVNAGWTQWLARAGTVGVDPQRGLRFANAALSLEAALAGHGVALAPRPLVETRVAAGSLVIPFDVSLPSPFAYYLVMHEAIARQAAVTAFRSWLAAEAAAPPHPSGESDR
ncbi:transcriptional regulator GcvA [Azoarcus sp. KH32C]|uniref:transcriptional regulator GcvA n=1 Tax=Azoarcus sp. KH32C TaxID=748247 RepID=UPI00023868BD|nr:transcriptional regulator GcvA [Azoarcus sp. KH32C]BAL26453.1 transcriptional regulator, LysR family [Azoarcus sp. KH32C]